MTALALSQAAALRARTQKIILVSRDEECFDVHYSSMSQSALIAELMELPENPDPGICACPRAFHHRRIIELPNIEATVLSSVIEFCNYHEMHGPFAEVQKPFPPVSDFEELVSVWDGNFIDLDPEDIYNLIMAANYLDIKGLMDLACAKVAWMILTLPSKELFESFGIPCEFSAHEATEWHEVNTLFKYCGNIYLARDAPTILTPPENFLAEYKDEHGKVPETRKDLAWLDHKIVDSYHVRESPASDSVAGTEEGEKDAGKEVHHTTYYPVHETEGEKRRKIISARHAKRMFDETQQSQATS